jgi:transcriptional antiterminator RfaH
VYSKPESERLVVEHLVRQGFDSWCPTLSAVDLKAPDAAQAARAPTALFPRYLFARPTAEGQSIAPIKYTVGVSRLVSFGNQPATIAHDHVLQIGAWLAAQGERSVADRLGIKVGQLACVTDGPFANFQGLVKMTGPERVIVLLDLMGKPHALSFSYASVRSAQSV